MCVYVVFVLGAFFFGGGGGRKDRQADEQRLNLIMDLTNCSCESN